MEGNQTANDTTKRVTKTTHFHRTDTTIIPATIGPITPSTQTSPTTERHTTTDNILSTGIHTDTPVTDLKISSSTVCVNHTKEPRRTLTEKPTSYKNATTAIKTTTVQTPETVATSSEDTPTTTTLVTETTPTAPFPCDGMLDAITVGADGMIYGFRGILITIYNYLSIIPFSMSVIVKTTTGVEDVRGS